MTKTVKGQNNILREKTKIIQPTPSQIQEILTSGKAPEAFSLSKDLKPEDISLDSVKSLSDQSFALWAVTSGATVDGHKVDFDKHRYLLPIYMDNSKEIAWIKAAQLGATVYMLLRSVWWLTVNQGRKAGLYFPNKEMVEMLSQDRLNPMLKSIPDVWNLIQDTEDQANRMTMKKIGASTFYLFHLGGKASKDSVPLDFVTFDEVRLCNSQDIDQALERISHSSHKYKIFMSTAGLPNNDIHARFLQGSQHVWRVKCGCSDGCDLPSTWPECVVEHPSKGLYLRCPKCGWEIKDTQNGRYVPMNESASFHSYRASQLNSKFISLREIWDSYLRTTNMKEFYNAKLGLPYIDEENQPIKQEHLDAAVDPSLPWAEPFHVQGTTAMGIDQGAGYCFAIIADIHEGKKRIRHVELIESDNPNYRDIQGGKLSPFVRLRELMQEYNVRVCVCDAMPNANDSLAFAQDFPGRVWLAFYTQGGTSPVQWKDRIKTPPAVQKAGPFLKFKYIAFLNRYLSMDAGLNAWVLGDVVTPEPRALIQTARGENSGRWEPEHPLERVHAHLKRLVRQFNVTNEETGEGKMVWVYAGKDPHLAHAWNYTNIALERLKRQVSFVFA